MLVERWNKGWKYWIDWDGFALVRKVPEKAGEV